MDWGEERSGKFLPNCTIQPLSILGPAEQREAAKRMPIEVRSLAKWEEAGVPGMLSVIP